MKKIKSRVAFIFLLLMVCLLTSCTTVSTEYISESDYEIVSFEGEMLEAKVVEINSDITETNDTFGQEVTVETIKFTAAIADGYYKGQLMEGRQVLNSTLGYRDIPVEVGDKVFLFPSYDEQGEPIGEFAGYSRTNHMIFMFVVFGLILILLSGLKGVRSLIGLIITCASIFFVMVPMVLNGYNPAVVAILISIFILTVTLVIVCKFTRKAFASILGCVIGVSTAGIISMIMQHMMKFTGIIDEHSILLMVQHNIDMNGLLFAAIIIGALGATMDVAVSIASSLEEMIETSDQKISAGNLIKSGMNIGSDIMGTMVNTLILAYVGSALPLILLLELNATNLGYVLSWEMISAEIIRALAGSIGLLLVVPATSIIVSVLYRKANGNAGIAVDNK